VALSEEPPLFGRFTSRIEPLLPIGDEMDGVDLILFKKCLLLPEILPYVMQSVPFSSSLVRFHPGSVVGIATAYGLGGPGIESRWGRDFPHLSRPS
jgi:hypothetical protein